MSSLNETSYRASLIRLLANPQEFNGKQVNVSGYMSKRGVWYIFPAKDMCENFDFSESIYVVPVELDVQRFAKIDSSHQECGSVSVTGEFVANAYYGSVVTLTHLPYTEGYLKNYEFF